MADEAAPSFTLVTGDPPYRVQRVVGLIPRHGLGIGRRAVFFALLAWLPLAVWAVAERRAFPGTVPEPLLQHFGIHVRCLLAIPLFIVAEGVVEGTLARQLAYLVTSGVISERVRPELDRILAGCRRLRDSWLVWAAILGLAVISTLSANAAAMHELEWAAGSGVSFGFGGHWVRFVTRPLFIFIGFGWIWRLILIGILLGRVAKLDLALVPTHPDRVGGLGLLEFVTVASSILAFAVSSVIASRLAHEIRYHGMSMAALRAPFVILLAVLLIGLLAPLLPLTGVLARFRRRALFEYGALVGRHGRSVRAKWIDRTGEVDADLLAAAELGPVVDTISMYEAVSKMRPTVFGKRSLIAIAAAVLLPMLPVLAMEVPLKEVLLKLLKALT
jgi:hypothetical protein